MILILQTLDLCVLDLCKTGLLPGFNSIDVSWRFTSSQFSPSRTSHIKPTLRTAPASNSYIDTPMMSVLDILRFEIFLSTLFQRLCLKVISEIGMTKNYMASRLGLGTFRLFLERGPSAKSFPSRSSFFIVLISFRSIPFCSVLSRRTVFPFRSVLGILS